MQRSVSATVVPPRSEQEWILIRAYTPGIVVNGLPNQTTLQLSNLTAGGMMVGSKSSQDANGAQDSVAKS
jgi:hypothetical protein